MFKFIAIASIVLYIITILIAVYYKRKAQRDYTGLYNKCWFESRLTSWMRHANGHPDHSEDFVLLFIDLNKFKAINDTYGHPAGDRVLSDVVAAIKKCIRKGVDYGIRWGGDEFVIVLNHVKHIDIEATAVALNVEFSKIKLNESSITYFFRDLNLTASIGGAIFKYGMKVNSQKFLKKVNDVMRKVKKDSELLHEIIYTDTCAPTKETDIMHAADIDFHKKSGFLKV